MKINKEQILKINLDYLITLILMLLSFFNKFFTFTFLISILKISLQYHFTQ